MCGACTFARNRYLESGGKQTVIVQVSSTAGASCLVRLNGNNFCESTVTAKISEVVFPDMDSFLSVFLVMDVGITSRLCGVLMKMKMMTKKKKKKKMMIMMMIMMMMMMKMMMKKMMKITSDDDGDDDDDDDDDAVVLFSDCGHPTR